MTSPASFVDEVLRINERYLVEVVEAFGLCPFAASARTSGRLERRVLLEATQPASLAAIEQIAADPRIEVAVLIYPRFAGPFEAFDAFVGKLRAADGRRSPPLALAPFHPQAPYGDETPQRLMMFFRRAPDPTLQLVRFSVLDAVKRGAPGGKFLLDFSAHGLAELARRAEAIPLSERIARANFECAREQGIGRLQALYDDIAADRAVSYARFDQSRQPDERATNLTRA